MKRIVAAACLTLCLASCTRIDGTESSRLGAGMACVTDFDCGPGRYCSADGLCAIDCVSTGDCALTKPADAIANALECSPCGRCLAAGARDDRCVQVADIPCTGDGSCPAGDGCGRQGFCARRCASDDDCAVAGRGWRCGADAGLCFRRCIRELDCIYHGWNFECALPAGVDPATVADAARPVHGECVPRVGGIDRDNTGGPDEASQGYHGLWGMLYTAAFRSTNIPLIGTLDTVNIQLDLVRIVQQGSGILIEYKVCTSELRNFRDDDAPFQDLVRLVTPDAFNDSLPLQYNHAADVPPLTPGATFETDTELVVVGARLADPDHDPLPSFRDPAGAYDEDRDGHAGMTLLVSGVMSGEMYMAQRSRFMITVGVVDRDHLQGPVVNDAEQSIIGASKEDLVYDMKVSRHPQADRSYFRAVRLPDTASCDDVIARGRMHHDWLTFEPRFDPAKRP